MKNLLLFFLIFFIGCTKPYTFSEGQSVYILPDSVKGIVFYKRHFGTSYNSYKVSYFDSLKVSHSNYFYEFELQKR